MQQRTPQHPHPQPTLVHGSSPSHGLASMPIPFPTPLALSLDMDLSPSLKSSIALNSIPPRLQASSSSPPAPPPIQLDLLPAHKPAPSDTIAETQPQSSITSLTNIHWMNHHHHHNHHNHHNNNNNIKSNRNHYRKQSIGERTNGVTRSSRGNLDMNIDMNLMPSSSDGTSVENEERELEDDEEEEEEEDDGGGGGGDDDDEEEAEEEEEEEVSMEHTNLDLSMINKSSSSTSPPLPGQRNHHRERGVRKRRRDKRKQRRSAAAAVPKEKNAVMGRELASILSSRGARHSGGFGTPDEMTGGLGLGIGKPRPVVSEKPAGLGVLAVISGKTAGHHHLHNQNHGHGRVALEAQKVVSVLETGEHGHQHQQTQIQTHLNASNTYSNNNNGSQNQHQHQHQNYEICSDEDGDGSSARKKLRLSKEQSALLEESFREHSTLNPKQKNALAKQLNLRPRQVEVWFQNRRARTKLKQTEVDCELLKRCCESLTEENRRLHKEVAELRALKVGAPSCVISHDFYNMPLAATTLTMCPSCERMGPHSSPSASTATATPPGAKTNIPSLPFQIKPPFALAFSPQQQSSAAC